MRADFFKYHALGNDYIVIDPNFFNLPINENAIKLICDRNKGIGSDGILYGPLRDENQVIWLRIFNPDGSEAEKSGNGLRIFAKYLKDAKYVVEDNFSIATKGGEVSVRIVEPQSRVISINMGKLSFQSRDIPVAGDNREVVEETLEVEGDKYQITAATIGNPHCVIFRETISKDEALKLGPFFENHPSFPNKTNVQFVKVLNRNTIQMEIWERGAGYTLASGSSSCAAAGAAHKTGKCDENIEVQMPGGNLKIEIKSDRSVQMTGSVSGVGYGFFTDDFKTLLK